MSGLLRAKIIQESVMGAKGRGYMVGYMDGLTPEGGNYVRAAESKGVWDAARKQITEKGFAMTTSLMNSVMQNYINTLLLG